MPDVANVMQCHEAAAVDHEKLEGRGELRRVKEVVMGEGRGSLRRRRTQPPVSLGEGQSWRRPHLSREQRVGIASCTVTVCYFAFL